MPRLNRAVTVVVLGSSCAGTSAADDDDRLAGPVVILRVMARIRAHRRRDGTRVRAHGRQVPLSGRRRGGIASRASQMAADNDAAVRFAAENTDRETLLRWALSGDKPHAGNGKASVQRAARRQAAGRADLAAAALRRLARRSRL